MIKIFNKLNVIFFTAIVAGLFLIFYDTISFNDNLSLSNKKAVAIVNETVISEDQFLRYATNLGADLDLNNDFEILDLLLERMIEEELLVQRGIELNLHKKDIGVRKEMITQVIDFIIQVEDNQITEADVRDYFIKNINKYAPTEKIKFDFIFLKSNNLNSVLLGTESDLKTLEIKISNINLELDTKTFSEVKEKYNENNLFNVPQKLINIKDCEQLLGKGICNQITMMETNSISEPIFGTNGFYIFKLYDIQKLEVNEDYFEEIKERIIFDYNNQLDDQKLKDYLIYLKENSSITRYDFQ